MKRLCLLFLFLLSGLAGAVELDGRTVILVVAEHRANDPVVSSMEAELIRLRTELGMSAEDMPIIFMGFADSDTDKANFDRLGFKAADAPVMCVVEWGKPARFGPKKVLGAAIKRHAEVQHSAAIVNAYLGQMGFDNRLPEPPGFGLRPTPAPVEVVDNSPGRLEIDKVRFEVGGKTLFLTNVGVRVRNLEQRTLRDVKVRVFAKPTKSTEWKLVDEQIVPKILAGNMVVRDNVSDSGKLGLVGDDGLALPSQYRIEVEHMGKVVSKEGDFVPITSP